MNLVLLCVFWHNVWLLICLYHVYLEIINFIIFYFDEVFFGLGSYSLLNKIRIVFIYFCTGAILVIVVIHFCTGAILVIVIIYFCTGAILVIVIIYFCTGAILVIVIIYFCTGAIHNTGCIVEIQIHVYSHSDLLISFIFEFYPEWKRGVKSKNKKAQPMCKFAQLYACLELFRF